ncbi:MAG: plasmid mobilization protein [Sphingobacterium sp.]
MMQEAINEMETKEVAQKATRQKRSVSDVKITTMTVRMTTKERRIIANKAAQAGMCTSEWIRRASRKAVVRKRICKQSVGHLRMMAGMANQLHALTQSAEANGLFAILVDLRVLLTKLELTMERMAEDDR